MKKTILILLSIIFFSSVASSKNIAVLESPDSDISTKFDLIENKLYYEMKFNDKVVVETSPVGLIVDGIDACRDLEITNIKFSELSTRYPIKSVHSIAKNHYKTIKISFISNSINSKGFFEAKAFNDGLAFRLFFNNSVKREITAGGGTLFKIDPKNEIWFKQYTGNYEACYTKAVLNNIAHETYMAPPITIELTDQKGFLAITEAALDNFTGMCIKAHRTDNRMLLKEYFKSGGNFRLSTDILTPWRVIIAGKDLNTLVNSDILYNCCPEPTEELAKANWIKPGRSVWSWLGGGGVTFENMKEYAKLAGDLNFEYNLVDEGWGHWNKENLTKWDLISELVQYSNKFGVKTWVWKACKDRKGIKGIYDREERIDFFKKCKEAGVVGVKIDFMDSESKKMVHFYNQTLIDAAEYGLMINFHGANKPTGLSRTWPNEVTREGVYGFEKDLRSWSRHNTIIPFTRFLAGHADYTPFSLGQRKGNTTWCHQIATLIVFTSPLTVYAEHPQNIIENPACEFIKKIPTVWDETIVLPESKIGTLAAFARRSKDCWYIGVLNGEQKKKVQINLNFLETTKYSMLSFNDVELAGNTFKKQTKKVIKNEILNIEMNKGGGFAAILSPLPEK